jgi:hypothetical protein
MLEIVRLVRSILEMLLSLGQPLRVMLVQPLITVGMLLFLYAGWHVRDEGSVNAGLRVAFVDTRAYRVEHQRDLETTMLQTQLHQAAQTDRLINRMLQALLEQAPSASRVRLDVFHNGVLGVTGTALLRYDVTNAVATRGHSVGALVVNRQLSDLSGLLPALLAGKCQVGLVAQELNIEFRARLEELGAVSYMACPVVDVLDRLLGGVLVQWDGGDHRPEGDAMQAIMDHAKYVAAQIASALDLRTPLPFPYGIGADD